MVLPSAFVERRVQVETPLVSELLQVPRVFNVPVLLKVGTVPLMGLLLASKIVIVMPAVSVPLARVGVVPAMVDVRADAGPGLKVTVPPALRMGVSIESVFNSAFVEESVQVEIPEALELEQVP